MTVKCPEYVPAARPEVLTQTFVVKGVVPLAGVAVSQAESLAIVAVGTTIDESWTTSFRHAMLDPTAPVNESEAGAVEIVAFCRLPDAGAIVSDCVAEAVRDAESATVKTSEVVPAVVGVPEKTPLAVSESPGTKGDSLHV